MSRLFGNTHRFNSIDISLHIPTREGRPGDHSATTDPHYVTHRTARSSVAARYPHIDPPPPGPRCATGSPDRRHCLIAFYRGTGSRLGQLPTYHAIAQFEFQF